MKKKVVHYKLSSGLMIVGIVVAFICFFNGVNLYHIMITQKKEKKLFDYKHVIKCIYDNMGEEISFGSVFDSCKGIVRLQDVNLYRDSDNTLGLVDIIMCQDEELIYPIIEGTIPKTDETINTPTVIIGRNQLVNTEFVDGKRYYRLEGVDCEVCAIIGSKGSELFDYKVILYYKGTDGILRQMIDRNNNVSFSIESNYGDAKTILKSIRENIKEKEYGVAVGGGDITDDEMSVVDDSAGMYVLIFVFSIVNIIIVSELWIRARLGEIAIRKIFGYSNYKIYSVLYRDMILNVIISVILAVVIQLVLNTVFEDYVNVYSSQMLFYILFSVAFVFFVSAILIVYPMMILNKQEFTIHYISKCR